MPKLRQAPGRLGVPSKLPPHVCSLLLKNMTCVCVCRGTCPPAVPSTSDHVSKPLQPHQAPFSFKTAHPLVWVILIGG